jgi:hypothetical protein
MIHIDIKERNKKQINSIIYLSVVLNLYHKPYKLLTLDSHSQLSRECECLEYLFIYLYTCDGDASKNIYIMFYLYFIYILWFTVFVYELFFIIIITLELMDLKSLNWHNNLNFLFIIIKMENSK